MIARLEGQVITIEDDVLILDISGVGFAVHVPENLAAHAGKRITLYTHLHVRENELALYGFTETEQKTLFELLLGVSGVGPKAALSLISTLSVDELRQAVVERQYTVLARAPGVGRKTAERIVLHLKDKVKQTFKVPETTLTDDDTDVIAALTALGFSIVEAQRAIQELPQDAALSIEDKIRQALASMRQ